MGLMAILKNLLFLLTICCLQLTVCYSDDSKDVNNKNSDSENENENYNSVFEATSEWQPLRKDQAIPRGLHVRLNLATGKREAKLLDPNEQESEIQEVSAVVNERKDDEPLLGLNVKELKNHMKKIPGDDRLIADDDIERIKRKFRYYEELKEELLGSQTAVKSDLELMQELVNSYKNLVEKKASFTGDEFKVEFDEEELSLLSNLEYMVHQIDNAREFVKTGLREIAFPSLNSSSSKIRYEAAKLLGSAVQSNPTAQVLALEAGAITVLLRTLSIDSSYKVKSGAVYALSCLLRGFPAAQSQLVQKGGVSTLFKLFQSGTSDEIKLQVKIITFINDLLLERKDTLVTLKENQKNKGGSYLDRELMEKLRQYREMELERRLKEGGWCTSLSRIMLDLSGELAAEDTFQYDEASARGDEPVRPEHDLMDNLSSAITCLVVTCGKEFTSDLDAAVKGLLRRYSHLASLETEPDSVFTLLRDKLVTLASTLIKHKIKDEL